MKLRKIKAIELSSYFVAGLATVFFYLHSNEWNLDLTLVRDVLDVFIVPYGVFLVLSLILYRISKSIPLAVLSCAVSILVLVYTLYSYIRVLYILKCNPRACWGLFLSTGTRLLFGGFGILIAGIVGIKLYSLLRRSSV